MRIIAVLTFLFSTNILAKRFANQYIEFELPIAWDCVLEGSEWVCQSTVEDRRKEAIIILAAKKRGANDSLDYYQEYLKKPKTYELPGGQTQVSEAKYVKMISVNEQNWVDAMHLASEVPGFYTRYLTTVKEDLGIALTFSVARDLYSNYQSVFDKVIDTIRVFRTSNNFDDSREIKISSKDNGNILEETTLIPDDVREDISINANTVKTESKKDTSTTADFIFYAIIALAVGVFIYIKKRKNKNDQDY